MSSGRSLSAAKRQRTPRPNLTVAPSVLITATVPPLQQASRKCQSCPTAIIGPEHGYWRLGCDSKCCVCNVCFSKCLNNRQCREHFDCPSCRAQTSSWEAFTPQSSRSGANASARVREGYHSGKIEPLPPPCQQASPVAYYESMNRDQRRKFVGITLMKEHQDHALYQKMVHLPVRDYIEWVPLADG